MILLHSLRAQNFKQLRDVNLCFPPKGSILIEGLNEAGKSSLFEAVFFGLYGKGLHSTHSELKRYGAAEMRVELEFSIQGRFYTLERRVATNQTSLLRCPSGEGTPEVLRGQGVVQARLAAELRISDRAMLNTCFVEQKGLERLESLDAKDRRETVNELLNLGALSRMEEEYRITRADTEMVQRVRQRVQIAHLDAELPGCQAARERAVRCWLYSRILDLERRMAELSDALRQIAAEGEQVRQERDRIAGLLREIEALRKRLEAVQGDLAHRLQAWDQAALQLTKADSEVQELEELWNGLPAREESLLALEELDKRLVELEQGEQQRATEQQALTGAERRLAARDELQRSWDHGEQQRGRGEVEAAAAAQAVSAAEQSLRERGRRKEHDAALERLLTLVAQCSRTGKEAADFAQQRDAARRVAALAEERERRVTALLELQGWLRQFEQDRDKLAQVSQQLERAEAERHAERERRRRIEALETSRAGCDLRLAESEAAVLGAADLLQQAQARDALSEWAAAADRLAEADPSAGRLVEVEQRRRETSARFHECAAAVQQASRRRTVAAVVALTALILGLGALSVQWGGSFGFVIWPLFVAGLVWALATANQVATARAEADIVQRTSDRLEGELQAVQREVEAAQAEGTRRRVREAECRQVVQGLGVVVPETPGAARDSLANLPSLPVDQARRSLETAQSQRVAALGDAELTRQRLAAEHASPGPGIEELEAHVRERKAELAPLQEAVARGAELPHRLHNLSLSTREDLPTALERARTEHATSRAERERLPALERAAAAREALAQEEQQDAEQLAQKLLLPGTTLEEQSQSAQSERTAFQRAVAALPDATLHAELGQARTAGSALRDRLTRLETEQDARRAELDTQPRESLVHDVTARREALSALAAALALLADVRPKLLVAGVPAISGDLRTQLAIRRSNLQQDRDRAGQLPNRKVERDALAARGEEVAADAATAWQTVVYEAMPGSPGTALQRLPHLLRTLEAEIVQKDEQGLRRRDAGLKERSEELVRHHATREHEITLLAQERDRLRRELGCGMAGEDPIERYPELREVGEQDPQEWETEVERCEDAIRTNRSDRRAQASVAGVDDSPLDLGVEREALAQAERELAVKKRAGEIVRKTRESIVNRVMPLTMQNLRQILPLLTEGRYQDAEWEESKNSISVLDRRAGSYQKKKVFSGGARDQISLALRLAFALATLPGEQTMRPGWLFLDEPLSSFDHARTQALVDLITRGLIRKQFDQIFLISHSQSFDPNRFEYRLVLRDGEVVESNLPSPARPGG